VFTLPPVYRRLPPKFTDTAIRRQHLPVAVTSVFRIKIKKYKSQKNGYRYSKNGKIYSGNGKVNPGNAPWGWKNFLRLMMPRDSLRPE